jgi:hypothetical protein
VLTLSNFLKETPFQFQFFFELLMCYAVIKMESRKQRKSQLNA